MHYGVTVTAQVFSFQHAWRMNLWVTILINLFILNKLIINLWFDRKLISNSLINIWFKGIYIYMYMYKFNYEKNSSRITFENLIAFGDLSLYFPPYVICNPNEDPNPTPKTNQILYYNTLTLLPNAFRGSSSNLISVLSLKVSHFYRCNAMQCIPYFLPRRWCRETGS